MPRAHALLVGIDRYPQLSASAQLSSCANDVAEMGMVLRERFGFPDETVSTLVNEGATREAILAGLVALRDPAAPGDVVLFYYTGHGSHLKDSTRQRPDGWNRSIVPHDARFNLEGALVRDITDDTLLDWLQEITRKTPNVALIADTCFSGGLLRDRPPRAKLLEPVVVPRVQRLPSPFAPRPVSSLRELAAPGERGPGESYVFLSASGRYDFANSLESPPSGAFTHHLCAVLRRLPPGATYRALLAEVRAAMSAAGLTQTPQIEGARDLEVFGGTFRRPDPFLPVLAIEGRSVVLGGGEMHGVRAGGRWGLFPPDTLTPGKAAPLAELRIVSVETGRASGELLGAAAPGAAIAPGSRAFASENETGSRGLPALGGRLLEGAAKTRNLLTLEPASEAGRALAQEIQVRLGTSGEGGRLVPLRKDRKRKMSVVAEGALLALEIRHTAPLVLYFHVLDIGLTGNCTPLYPPAGENVDTYPGYLLRIDGPKLSLPVGLPKDFPPDLPGGQETLKIFATSSPADLRFWDTRNLRESSAHRAPRGGLQDEINAACGLGAPALREGPAGPEVPEAWTVLTVSFWVERSPRKEST